MLAYERNEGSGDLIVAGATVSLAALQAILTRSNPKINPGFKVGEQIGKLGKVIENTTGQVVKSIGLHVQDMIKERNINVLDIFDAIKNPLVTLSQDGGNKFVYITQKVSVVVDKAGKIITAVAKEFFDDVVKEAVNRGKK